MKHFNLEFLLTRTCDQNCYYCNNSKYDPDNEVEVDLDYISWVLETYNKLGVSNMRIELSGGEPGMVKNFEKVIDILRDKNYITKIFLLSNGRLRKKYGDIKKFVGTKFAEYQEHTALEIIGKEINYFNKDITFFNSYDYMIHVLVLSELTLRSLMNNYNYFAYELGLFERNIDLKLITPKTEETEEELLNNTLIFYERICSYPDYLKISRITYDYSRNNAKYIERALKHVLDQNTINICSKISPLQFIDLENKLLGKCSMQVEQCEKEELSEENIKRALEGKLFTTNTFCKKCYKYFYVTDCFLDRVIKKRYYNIK